MKRFDGRSMTKCLLFFGAVLLLGGCAAADKPDARILWPPPPNEPKLEWIGTYWSLDQMPKTAAEKMSKSLLGGQPRNVFMRPIAVASSGKGKIFVSDADRKQIIVYDTNKRSVYPFSQSGAIRSPVGMALDKSDRLFVADSEGQKILVFGSDDTPLFSFGGPENLEHPAFIALDEQRNKIYVSDARAHRIVVFDFDGKYLKSFGEWGAKDGSFYGPQGLAVDSDGNLYVADMFNARMQVFNTQGSFLRKFGERGDKQWNFEMPMGVAIDSDGNLHITDTRKKAMVTYDREGRLLLFTGGGGGAHLLSLALPGGVWVDKKDQVYVVDQIGRRFAIWQYLNDEYLKEHPIE